VSSAEDVAETLRITHFDTAGARAMTEALVSVYAEIYAHKADDPFYSVERYAERLRAHSSGPGYELVVGRIDGTIVGYAYGVPLPAGTAWWNGLVDPLPPELIEETGRRTFALNEIMVRQAWRRGGVARRLHDDLMAGRTEERATLLVEQGNAPARTAYRRWGWREIGYLQPFPDAPVYASMLLDLVGQPPPREQTRSSDINRA
jgi:GNAT superfamily N-acetyltransferase